MALLKRKHEDFCLLLISLLSFLPLTATFSNDCNGKSFHCVNSTHFMICVDVGGGVSMTVDDLIIQCPPTTSCQSTNNFECEYQESTALNEVIKKSEITNDPTFLNVISLDQSSTQMPMFLEDSITSVLPLEKYSISSKPSQISDTNTKTARPKVVSNIIKKDVMIPKIVQNDIPEIDRENGLDLDGSNGNNSQPSLTKSTSAIDRLQNNISSTINTNFTFSPLAINGEEIITNIPNITKNGLEIENKESTSSSSLPVLDNIITKDMFSKIPNTNSKFKPDVGVDSNNGGYILAVNKTSDAIINANGQVAKEHNINTSFFLNGTLTNTLSNYSGLENNHNVSKNVLNDSVINNKDLSAPSELKAASHFVTLQNIKPVLASSEKFKIASDNNYITEMQAEKLTTNYETINSLNGTSNMKIDTSETAVDQYPEYDEPSMNNTVPKKSLNDTQLEKIPIQSNVDPSVTRKIKKFENNDDLITLFETKNSSAVPFASENIKSDIVPSNERKTISNYDSTTESQLKHITNESAPNNIDSLYMGPNGKTDLSTSKTEEEHRKNDNLFLNTTLSNDLVNNVKLKNIYSQNIDLSVNGEINKFRNIELSTASIELPNSSTHLNSSENIKYETMSPDKPKTISYNNFDVDLQKENKTNNNESIYSSNNNLNTKFDVNTNTIKDEYPKNDNVLKNTTMSNKLVNNTKLENIQSQNIDLSVNGEIKNFVNSENRTVPIELQNLSAQSTAPENIKPEVNFPDKPKTISYDNSNVEMQMEKETNNNENVYSSKTLNANIDANTYTTEKQYTKIENNTKLENKNSQNIDLNVKTAINIIGNTENTTIIDIRNSSVQSIAPENIKSEILSSDKSKTISENNSNIDRHIENETNNNENVYYSYNTLNPKDDANTNTKVEQNPNNDNLLSNTSLLNKSVNYTNLENIQSIKHIDLSVNGAIDNFTNNDDPSMIELRSSFDQLTASENIKSKTNPSDKLKATSNNDSIREKQQESKANNNGNLHSSKISLNVTIDANTNTTEEQYHKSDNLFNNTANTNQQINNTKSENIQSKNIYQSLNGEIKNFGNSANRTLPVESQNLSIESTASENIKTEANFPDKLMAISYDNSEIEMQIDNETKNNKNVYSSKALNANIDANTRIHTTEKQYTKIENVFNGTTTINELVNDTKLENKQSQNIDLNVKGVINSIGNTENPTIIDLRNSSAQSIAPENIKSEILSSDKSKTISENNSNIDRQIKNEINNNETVYYSYNTSNAKADADTNTTVEHNPKNDNLLSNTTMSNKSVNNTNLENIRNQNIDQNVNGAINNFKNTEDPSMIELRNSFNQSTPSQNIKSQITPPDKTTNDSNTTMQPESKANNNANLHSSNSSLNVIIDADTNATEEQYPKWDNLFNNTAYASQLLNNTKSENIQRQNIYQSVNVEIQNFGNSANRTLPIELRNLSTKSTVSENIKYEVNFVDKPKNITNNNSDIDMQMNNEKVNSLNVTLNAEIDANTNTPENQYSENKNLFNNTTITNELVNKTRLKDIRDQNIDLNVKEATNSFGKIEDKDIIELKNSSVQIDSPKNKIFLDMIPDKYKSTRNNNSYIKFPLEDNISNNGNVYSSNIKIDTTTNTTENQYPQNNNMFYNKPVLKELLNNTKLENKQNQNIDLNVNKVTRSFGNIQYPTIPVEIRNLSAQSTTPKNIKLEIISSEKPKFINYDNSDTKIQIENKYDNNENVFSSNSSKNNLLSNITTSNELVNNTRLKNIQNQTMNLGVKGKINNFKNAKDPTIIESRYIFGQSTTYKNINSELAPQDKPKVTSNNDSNIEYQTENKPNDNGNVYSFNISSNVKIGAYTNTKKEQYSKNDNFFNNTIITVNNTKLENIQSQNMDLSVNGGINDFGITEHPNIIELRNLSAQSSASENIKNEIISPDKPKTIGYHNSDIEMPMENETNKNENVYYLNSSSANIDANTNTSEDKYSKNKSLYKNTNISSELVNNTKLENIQSQNTDLNVKGVMNNFENIKDKNIIKLRNLPAQSTASQNMKFEIGSQDKPKASSNNDSRIEMQIANKTNNRNVHSPYISTDAITDENINTTEKQYLKNKLFLNTSFSNDLLMRTKLENTQLGHKNFTVNGAINNIETHDDPAVPIELKNSLAQLNTYVNEEPKIVPLSKITNNNSSSIEIQAEKETNNTIYNLNITSKDKIDATELGYAYSKTEMQIDNQTNHDRFISSFNINTNTKFNTNIKTINIHPVLIEEISNGTDLENIKSHIKNQSTSEDIENFIDKEDTTVLTKLKNSFAQSNKSEYIESENNSPDIPKIYSNNNSAVDIEKREDWYNDTEHDIFKVTTDAIQPTLSSATSIDNSLAIISNIHENVRKAELQPNSEYYSVFTVAEIISESTSGKPNFVDQYAIMNNETIVNNTSNDDYLIDGAGIFKRNFDIRPVNGSQSVSNVTIPNTIVQENIIFAHENYRVDNDQNGTMYINNNMSETNEKSMILFNRAIKADENYSGILDISNTTVIENSTQSTTLDKSRKNINNQTNILTINGTVANSSLAKVSSKDKVLTKNNNDPKSLSEESEILMVKGKMITNYSSNISEVAETVSNTRMNKLNNSVLTNIVNSTETITDVLITTDKSFMSTYMLHSINNLDKDENLHRSDVKSSTQTILAKFPTSTEMVNFTEVSEVTKSSVRNVNLSLDRILFGTLKYTTQKNYKEGPNSETINESLTDSFKYLKFSQIPPSVETDTPYSPVTTATNNYYTQNVETSSIASNFQEKQFSDVTEEVDSAFSTSFSNESKKNMSIIPNGEILFDTDISTVHDVQNISKTINNIIIKTLSTSRTQNVTEKQKIVPELKLYPTYNSNALFSNIVHNNGTIIVTNIKPLLHSSKETNLTKAERPMESDVNTKILHYNNTKIDTSYNKYTGAKHVTTTDTLGRNDKGKTKFSIQSYAVSHRDTTNMTKFPPASSEKTMNASYSVKCLNLTNNNNYKVDKIQFNNTTDKMSLRDVTTEINLNKANNNNTIKYDAVRNTGLAVITTKISSALKTNESKIIETVTKSSVLGNTRIKPVLPNFFCRNNSRGRFADENNCRRFYICIGNLIPVLGLCPENTVFSEFRKQCTKNVSHCIRHNQFKCSKEGRFIDIWYENIYYICIKDAHQRFVSFKFQCQNGYRLNKTNVTCNKFTMPKSSSSSSSTSLKDDDIKTMEKATNENSEENKPLKSKSFKCESEGKFSDPTNCRRYYVCSKTSKSRLRRKRKKCDSDEIFDSDKNKCVDKDSHECK